MVGVQGEGPPSCLGHVVQRLHALAGIFQNFFEVGLVVAILNFQPLN